ETTVAWLVQVKYQNKKTNKTDVEAFLKQIDAVQQAKGYPETNHWYVSKGGYTEPARDLLQELNIYFSDMAQFNALSEIFGFLGFPTY
ncbi:MAG: hypothetical protein AAF639_39815, partial [Chloroflexota bacterium]